MVKNIGVIGLFLLVFYSIAYADVETEPNNNKETSDTLVSGTPMTGQLSSKTDEDWFNFSVTAPDILNIVFSQNSGYNYLYYPWKINVVDFNGTILSSTKTGDKSTKIEVGVSNAGKYYIVIVTGNDSYDTLTVQYTLTVSSVNASPGCTGSCSQDQLNSYPYSDI